MIPSCQQQNVYSSEEQVIGKWIDNKPLYRKVYLVAEAYTKTSGEIRLSTNINNINEIVNIYGKCDWNYPNTLYYTFPIPYLSVDLSQKVQLFYYKNNNELGFNSTVDLLNIYAVLEYTKTTD